MPLSAAQRYVLIAIICLLVFLATSVVVLLFNRSLFPKTTLPFPNTPSQLELAAAPEIPSKEVVRLLAVGDMMLDRSVWLKTKAAGSYDHPFLLIDALFSDYDLRLGNLEGPITNFQSIANGTGGARFTFTFSPLFAEPLSRRFDILSLANNHTHNFGQAGLEQTKTVLTETGIAFFGDPNNDPLFLSFTTSSHGITLGFLGFHELIGSGFDEVVNEAERLNSEVDVLIAMPHWGTEYVTDKPNTQQIQEAHALIDAGVDMVIGAHPHVIQPIEQYNDRLIFYSLGNFIFDQYFSEETMQGLTLGITIEKTDEHIQASYDLIPISINTLSQPFIANASTTERILGALAPLGMGTIDQEAIGKGRLETRWAMPMQLNQ